MKPFRIRLTHVLIKSYELLDYMVDIDLPDGYFDQIDMTTFHSDDYIELLKNISPENYKGKTYLVELLLLKINT